MNRKLLIGSAGAVVALGAIAFLQFRNTTTPVAADTALARFEQTVAAVDTTIAPTADVEATDGVALPPPTSAVEAEAPVVTTTTLPSADAGDPASVPAPESSEPVVADRPQLPLPEPGVYQLVVEGSESIDLLTGASRDYPADGFLTVTAIDCGVELRFDFVVERWQSMTLCEGESAPELAGEQIFHSFFGQDDLVVRSCENSPLGVGAEAWSCAGESSIAERSVTTSIEPREIPGGTTTDVLIVATELELGDHPDNVETIEQWWDFETGLPVLERRAYDFTLDTPLGDAGYVENYELRLASFEPIS